LFIEKFVGASFGKRVALEKKEIIFRLALLPDRASLYLPSFTEDRG